jgi:ribosomal protein S18 acetylase RimI-like enzyme
MAAVPFRSPTLDDADRIVSLLVACDIVDFGTPDYDRDALLEEWSEPGVDLERDAFLTDGAYGLLLGTEVRAWVHPDLRDGALGDELADRLEARAREKGLPQLDWQVPRRDTAGRARVEERGYALVRSYGAMRLPDAAVGSLPAGQVRPYDPERDEAAVQALFERELGGGVSRVEALDVLLARNPDTSLWFVADAEDGSLAGAIRSELRPAGFITGYLTGVATDPAHRRGGHAGALVGAAARELVARGAVLVRTHVRSTNPGARAFFERLGFGLDWDADEFRLMLG